jgi:hypothetical protein
MRGNSGCRVDLRERRPWPPDLRFEDAPAERVIVQAMPPKPVIGATGSCGKVVSTHGLLSPNLSAGSSNG